MTMGTINLLMGIDAIFFTLGVALRALAYVREALRAKGGLSRWNYLFVVVLAYFAWSSIPGVGQDFARARDARLLAEPADIASLIAVVFFTLVSAAILTADTIYWRRAFRSLAA